MTTYLLTWNPKVWNWDNFDEDYYSTNQNGYFDTEWSCGNSRRIKLGDRVFLLKQGVEPRGLIASGFVIGEPAKGKHYSQIGKKAGKKAWYINVTLDILLHHETEILLKNQIIAEALPATFLNTQSSGISIPADFAIKLEKLWESHLRNLGLKIFHSSDEVIVSEQYWEGTTRKVSVNAFERDPRARTACLQYYGYRCHICNFDFHETYGVIGKDYIHVHHLKPLSDIREEYIVDPIADMRPVCANCHSMIHRQNPAFTIEFIKEILLSNHKK